MALAVAATAAVVVVVGRAISAEAGQCLLVAEQLVVEPQVLVLLWQEELTLQRQGTQRH